MTAILAAVVYFGWPVIEAFLIILPIPDPSESADKIKSFGQSTFAKGQELMGQVGAISTRSSDYK